MTAEEWAAKIAADYGYIHVEDLECAVTDAIQDAVAKEREACAAFLDAQAGTYEHRFSITDDPSDKHAAEMAVEFAAKIRACIP